MRNWHLIEKQPLLSEIYKKPPLVSYKRGCSIRSKTYSWEPNYEKVACEQALSAARSRVLARLASFAQIGELLAGYEKAILRAGESCRPVNPIVHQIRVKMQLACFFNVLEWWLLIERNQSQWPDSRVLLAFALHLAGQPLYGNSMAPSGSSSSCPFVVSFFFLATFSL